MSTRLRLITQENMYEGGLRLLTFVIITIRRYASYTFVRPPTPTDNFSNLRWMARRKNKRSILVVVLTVRAATFCQTCARQLRNPTNHGATLSFFSFRDGWEHNLRTTTTTRKNNNRCGLFFKNLFRCTHWIPRGWWMSRWLRCSVETPPKRRRETPPLLRRAGCARSETIHHFSLPAHHHQYSRPLFICCVQ